MLQGLVGTCALVPYCGRVALGTWGTPAWWDQGALLACCKHPGLSQGWLVLDWGGLVKSQHWSWMQPSSQQSCESPGLWVLCWGLRLLLPCPLLSFCSSCSMSAPHFSLVQPQTGSPPLPFQTRVWRTDIFPSFSSQPLLPGLSPAGSWFS